MSMQDPIANMLARIRNAQMASHKSVTIPYSNIKERITAVLKNEGYIEKFEILDKNPLKYITIHLKYYNNVPVIKGLRRVSKPSKRFYVASSDDKALNIMGGLGTAILTTPKGVISGKEAASMKCGGELLCYVY